MFIVTLLVNMFGLQEFYVWCKFCRSGYENVSVVFSEYGPLRDETRLSNTALIKWRE